MMMSFNDFLSKYKLKKKVTSEIRFCQVLFSVGLKFVGIYLQAGPVSSDIGIVNVHPTKETHWVAYVNEKYFDSYGCLLPNKLAKFTLERNGFCSYSS